MFQLLPPGDKSCNIHNHFCVVHCMFVGVGIKKAKFYNKKCLYGFVFTDNQFC